MSAPACRRCGAPLGSGYATDLVAAAQHHGEVAPDGALVVSTVLAATSACSWNCLAVLAAQLAGPDADAAVLVVAERERQVTAEGWTPEHDDAHPDGEMAAAGVLYAIEHTLGGTGLVSASPPVLRIYDGGGTEPGMGQVHERRWPWDTEWWKPKDRLRDLVRAGALIAAEADRDVRARRDRF